MRRVPTSVTVISVIGIIFTVLGVIGLFVTAAALGLSASIRLPNPALDVMRNDPGYMIGTGLSLAIGLPLMIALAAGSIGGLSLKPWAHSPMVIYAWGTIVNVVAGTVFSFAYVLPLVSARIPANDPTRMGAVIGGYVGACSGVLGMIFPICILYFYTRSHVVNAFQGIFAPTFRDPEEDDNWDDRGRNRDEDDYDDRRNPPGDSDRITDRPR